MTTPGEVAEAVRGLVGALTAVQSSDVTPMEATSSYLDPRVQVEQWEIHVAAMMKVGNLLIHDLAMARRTFEECIAKYPYSTPAASAKYELKRIKY